jgi:hypothetical protein
MSEMNKPSRFTRSKHFPICEMALEQSIQLIRANENLKKTIGEDWEAFLVDFIGNVRDKGKQSNINLLSLISFPRLR